MDWETLLERLWRHPIKLSRNKNFDLYTGRAGRRALRAYRLLRSLKRDLQQSAEIAVHAGPRQAAVSVELRALHGRRRVLLSARMFSLLLDDPDVGERLRAARDDGGDEASPAADS